MKPNRGLFLLLAASVVAPVWTACGSDDSAGGTEGSGAANSVNGLDTRQESDDANASDGTVDFAVLGLTSVTQEEIRDAYCDTFARALCGTRANCCSELPEDENREGFGCVSGVTSDCYLAITNGLRDGDVLSSERVAYVLEQVERFGSVCQRVPLPRDDAAFAIRTLPLGSECDDWDEAFPGLSPSAEDNVRCEAGLRCVDDLCAVPVSEGGACDSHGQCDYDHDCRGGVCVPFRTEGDACSGAPQDCRRPDGEALNTSLSRLVCSTDAADSTRLCVPPQPNGAPCTAGDSGDECNSGACIAMGSSTNIDAWQCAPCVDDDDCSGSTCLDGVCTRVFEACSEEAATYARF